jgi:hypothetical protein
MAAMIQIGCKHDQLCDATAQKLQAITQRRCQAHPQSSRVAMPGLLW